MNIAHSRHSMSKLQGLHVHVRLKTKCAPKIVPSVFFTYMENGPFTDYFPIKTSTYNGFSIAMLNNQRVNHIGDRSVNHPPLFQYASSFFGCSSCLIYIGDSLGISYGDTNLVGGIPTPLKNMKVSLDDYSQNMEK